MRKQRRAVWGGRSLLEQLEQRRMLSSSPVGLQPAQVLHAYGFDQVSFTNSVQQQVKGDGTGQTIAIVDAYDDPSIFADLDTFDQTFSLNGSQSIYSQYGSASSFLTKKTVARSTPTDAGWSMEMALDVEWAHAIAPGAKILLVEAASSNLGDLLNAVNTARQASGVSVVSMSWGGSEFSSETSYDSYFTTPRKHNPVSFVASSGDNGSGTLWPAVSPNVLSVGGTSLTINTDNSYASETAWNGSGGGVSVYESKPSYQSSVTQSSTKRTSPDVAYDADPSTGFAVYDSVVYNGQSGWLEVGGTSAGAPQWAALIAIANQGRSLNGLSTLDGRSQTLNAIYNMGSADFHDITTGSNGGYAATTGYDLVTGRGTPLANRVIPALVSASSSGTVSSTYQATTTTTNSTTTLFSDARLAPPAHGAPVAAANPAIAPSAFAQISASPLLVATSGLLG